MRSSRADLAAIIGPLRIKQFETARKTTQALRDVFKWSVAYEYRKDNPADDALEVLLPKVKPGVETPTGPAPFRRENGYSQNPQLRGTGVNTVGIRVSDSDGGALR